MSCDFGMALVLKTGQAVHLLAHHSKPADTPCKAELRLQTVAYHERHIPGFLLL